MRIKIIQKQTSQNCKLWAKDESELQNYEYLLSIVLTEASKIIFGWNLFFRFNEVVVNLKLENECN